MNSTTNDPKKNVRKGTNILGWGVAIIITGLACMWAYWGSIEAFHEGWYYPSFWQNLLMTFAQYLSPMLGFMLAGAVAIRWPRVGSGLFGVLALAAGFLFNWKGSGLLLITLPLILLGIGVWFGRPQPRRIALWTILILPLVTALVCGAYPAWRVAQRQDDGLRGERLIQGNGITLVWAPQGPGWPERGGQSWQEAISTCQNLSQDGLTVLATPQNIWHLPSPDELVRSMSYHGQNSGGVWDPQKKTATYATTPDKETPLWDPRSLVIYWWTSEQAPDGQIYFIVYDGAIYDRQESSQADYLGFRCVRTP